MKKIALLLVFALVVQLMPVNTQIVFAQEEVEAAFEDSAVIDGEIIPDETLLNCIKHSIGKAPEDSVTYGEIKDITTLSYPVETTKNLGWDPIETLEGIGILTKLYSLKITGHNVKDLTPLADNKNLYSLWAEDNKISVMPDFSDMSMSAFYIDRNRMTYETLYANMPNDWKQYAANKAKYQVPETVGTIASDKCYEIKDKYGNSYYPFIMESTNIRTSREYSIKSVTVDGVDMTDKFELMSNSRSADPDKYGFDCPYIYVAVTDGDFMTKSESHNIKAVITDEFDETFTLETDCVMEPMQDKYEIKVNETEYLSTTGVMKTGIKIDDRSFFTKEGSVTVNKVELIDKDGKVYGTISSGQSYQPYNLIDERYSLEEMRINCQDVLWEMVGNYTNVCQTMFTTYSTMYVRETLKEGFYDLVYTLTDGTKYIYVDAYEAVTRPIIYGIMDTDSVFETSNAVVTDQTGDYVSVYVYGWNITKDAVKPVFYNPEQEAISGDVAAVETDKWGAYYRIEKENPNSDDWNIDLYMNSTTQTGTKQFDVKVETEKETFEEEVYITRRENFYQYYDNRDNSFTVYFAQKADVDTDYSPTLSFVKMDYDVYEYVPIVTVDNGVFTEQVNSLTGQKEIKVKFSLTDSQISIIKENEYDLYYSVEYKNEAGELKSNRSEYLSKHAQGGYDFEDVPEKGIFSGYDTNVFYLPYWIGGVHSIQPTDEEAYYLTEDDVDVLSDGKFAYAGYWEDNISLDNTDFAQRSYNYYFMKVGEPPVAPVGKPVLSAKIVDEYYELSWTEVSGANRYNICLKYGDAVMPFSERVDSTYRIEAEILPMLFMECFEECRVNADESKMEIYVQAINNEDGVIAYGEKSNVFTVAGLKGNSGNTGNAGNTDHTHTTKVVITKAKDFNDGSEKTVCTSCNEVIKENVIYGMHEVTSWPVVYNGKNQTPKVVIKDRKGNLIDKSNYIVSKVKNVGMNKLTITFLDSSKYYAGTFEMTTMVKPKATSITKVTGKKKSIVLKWKKQNVQTKGYQIQYSTNKNFKSNTKTVTIKKNKTTSYTIKKLKAKKKYYVRIRTYKGKCYSEWSKKKSVKTK